MIVQGGAALYSGYLAAGTKQLGIDLKSPWTYVDGAMSLATLATLEGPKVANIGQKLDYFFGRATGRLHNLERSADMLRQLQRIGLPDTAANRAFLESHLNSVLNNASNIVRVENGIVVRESFLMGPYGGVKLETFWDGDKLLSGKLRGGP